MAVFGDTGCLLKDLTAVRTFPGQNLVNTALTDVGIALTAQAGIHKQLVDIPQSGRLAVNIVFAVTAAIIPPGDHNLISVIGKGTVSIVQRQCCLGKAHRRTLLGAAKDHVLHFRATEGLGGLLTHNPQNGVGNIGFAGTVGADDGGNVIAKADQCLIREGLKALNFQTF